MSIMGFQLPPFDAVAYGAVGFIVPPMVTNWVMRFVPTNWQMNQGVMWGVRALSVIVPAGLVKRYVSRRAGYYMLVGGAIKFALDLAATFAPGMIPGLGSQPFLGAYVNRQRMGMGMGKYYDQQPRRQALGAASTGSIFAGTPERLSPSARF